MDLPQILTMSAAVLTALIAALFPFWSARGQTNATISQSITAGFQQLTDQLQQERTELQAMLDKLRAENDALMLQNRELLRRCDDMETALRFHGVEFSPTVLTPPHTP